VGGNPWNVVLHYVGSPAGSAYTQAQLNAMISAINTPLGGFAGQWPPQTTVTEYTAVDIGSAQPAEAAIAANIVGTAVGEQDAASCVMFNYPVAQRYRGGKPRSYLPGFAGNFQQSPVSWTLSAFDSALTSWQAVIAGIASAGSGAGVTGCAHCVVLYNYVITDDPARHKYIRTRTSVKNVVVVGTAFGSVQIRTQRRRLGAR